ncbi:MAG: hypothetical protein CMK81_02180, partial [Pseudomonadales bacterium]|nr:hypothetical protein [Pseudomonadales bacterium]
GAAWACFAYPPKLWINLCKDFRQAYQSPVAWGLGSDRAFFIQPIKSMKINELPIDMNSLQG